ncbi:MAG: AMP-binding protein [Anaerolineae bacterium]|nr:AMP-binding protein [Anaerolineae bacterium]
MGDLLPAGPRGMVLLTGASGFLGAQVARRLLACTDYTVCALIRAEDPAGAAHRLSRAWWDWPELAGAIGRRVQVLAGDVGQVRLGLSEDDYAGLVAGLTHIVHTAADLRVNAPIAELRKTNLQGTGHVLELAQAAQADHGLARYAHVSTAYVAGGRSGPVPEDALTDAHGFSCAYEFSKYEGERLVQAARDRLPISVFRPGMIVGDSATGEIKTFNTLYFPLRLYLEGRLPLMPAGRAQRVNLVPVDYVADAIVRLTLAPEAAGLNFHLTAPYATLPQTGELVAFVRTWAWEQLGLRLPRPAFLPLPLPRGRYDPARPAPRDQGMLASLRTLLPYFNERLEFRRDNVDRLLGPYALDWRAFLPQLLAYAVDAGFMHRSERTVHEQILYRLSSKNRPITYHDIRGDRIVARSGQEVRLDVLAAMAALKSLGIGPGDRVAIAGTNSTRYLTLDVAIGMLGAVSVPVYYTSPPADIDHILAASGARLLFVGFNRVLERLGELHSDAPVISFCSDLTPVASAAADARPVMAWDAFLALGRQQPPDPKPQSPVGFGDLATLRYTSGTTGRPKGVMFRHDGLRWMGETMAALLPWRSRTRPARYLSFLPLNHVVEGILVAYAGYYIPQALDIYFLEDFRQAQRYLPQVKPTFFFSVPRVFERAWEGLEESGPGKFYLGLSTGTLKNALRPLLRWSLLGKLGLRGASQLAIGSAVASEKLLLNFRELGIELHNAYGLTEAPLVTLNRAGANRIGTVGAPLPATEVRLAEDGEVLVRGPQVTAGYFEADAPSPIQDGWLHTGDLGRLTADGYLVLEGRKKELFKTSYGKYVQPAKIEALLRDIPGIAETLLVGEGRPYCVALLWIIDPDDAPSQAAISQAMADLGRGLSHPEQVKRWAVLRNDLSIERGDLTANLKLKRQAVGGRLQGLIEALYDGSPAGAAVLNNATPGSLCEGFLFAGEAARD